MSVTTRNVHRLVAEQYKEKYDGLRTSILLCIKQLFMDECVNELILHKGFICRSVSCYSIRLQNGDLEAKIGYDRNNLVYDYHYINSTLSVEELIELYEAIIP